MIHPLRGGRHPLEVSSLAFLVVSTGYQLGAEAGCYQADPSAVSLVVPTGVLILFNLLLFLSALGTLLTVFHEDLVTSHILERAGCLAVGGLIGFYAFIILSYAGSRGIPTVLIIAALSCGYLGRAWQCTKTLRFMREVNQDESS